MNSVGFAFFALCVAYRGWMVRKRYGMRVRKKAAITIQSGKMAVIGIVFCTCLVASVSLCVLCVSNWYGVVVIIFHTVPPKLTVCILWS